MEHLFVTCGEFKELVGTGGCGEQNCRAEKWLEEY